MSCPSHVHSPRRVLAAGAGLAAAAMNADWQFFMGYRFGIFKHPTRQLGS